MNEQHSIAAPEDIVLSVNDELRVSGLLQRAPDPKACLVLAHGAGAGMRHPFLANVASGLAARNICSLRYQFPYMEKGAGRPDSPAVAHATVRAAVTRAAAELPNLPLFAGGKSFGGRMSSQTQAESPLPQVRGLVFLGFPLHPPGKPSVERGEHLFEVKIPMLFLQGGRDEFAQLPLLQSLVEKLGARATLKLFPQADHSFHVPKKSGRTDSDVRAEMLDTIREWMGAVCKV